MFAHGELVIRQRATPVLDPYSGEPTDYSWDDPDLLDLPGCGFDPGGSVETSEVGRAPIVTQPTVYADPSADVLAGDRLVVRGRTWEVDGDPADWRNPFTGWRPGLVIKLKAVSG